MDGNDEWVSATVAAASVGISARTLRYWMKAGKLPARETKQGRRVLLEDVRKIAEDTGRLAGNENRGGAAMHGKPTGVASGNATAEVATTRGNAVAVDVFDRLDRLYREQIEARDVALGAKDETIAELRRRAEEAERERDALRGQSGVTMPTDHEAAEHRPWWRFWRS